jgi:tellurite resistance protein TerC
MDTIAPIWLWAVFIAAAGIALFVDFAVLKSQGSHRVGAAEALRWSAAWIAFALAFNALLWWAVAQEQGPEVGQARALEFLTGYLIEKSLAVDNIFVFLMILTSLGVPPELHKRVLMFGVVGAIALRTVMILIGAWLIAQFHGVLMLFGALLVLTGLKMAWAAGGGPSSLEDSPVLRMLRRAMPVSENYDGERWFTRQAGRRLATPLLLVILLVAITDVIFAVDSIPAIFAITTDPFIVLSSNIFAVLGMRAMYFLLAAAAARFHLLSYGLAVVLVFVGGKMLLADLVKIPSLVSLGVVVAILALTMLWSHWRPPKVAATAQTS